MNTSFQTASRARASRARNGLAIAVLSALCATYAYAAPNAGSAGTPIPVTGRAHFHAGDAILGSLPVTQPIRVSVALKLRNKAALDAFVAKLANDRRKGVLSPPMTSAQTLANFSPTAAQAQKVADYLTSMGFRNVVVSPNRMVVNAEGTALTAANAFQTSFAQVRTRDGRIAYANTVDARVPASLADTVQGIFGLETVNMAHTYAKALKPHTLHTNSIPSEYVGHNPTDFPQIYNVGSAPAATGVTAGIITAGTMNDTEAALAEFFTVNPSLPAVVPSVVTTDGTCSSGCTDNDIEWEMDSQDLTAMSGGVNALILYTVPALFLQDVHDDFNTAQTANVAKVINVSLGLCETDYPGSLTAADDTTFELADAQGQTFSVSAGDRGSDSCGNGGTTPEWPGSSQYVVAVAGTYLNTLGTTIWNSEVVWNELAIPNGATGGSPSTFEPQPSWQAGVVPAGVTTRDAADVAYDGDPNSGALVIIDSSGDTTQEGGTSLSAPLFAGAWARMVQAYPTIGFAAPTLYKLSSADLHDVTSGNNGGETAGVGYDSASGLGTLIVGNAFTDIGSPPTPNFSYIASGATVNFTDTSTDPFYAVNYHLWSFGDHSTRTSATNPSHTYAASGTYTVTEIVKNTLGGSATKTEEIRVSIPSPQLLKNTGFESGVATPWNLSAGVLTENPVLAHNGGWYADLGQGSGAHRDTAAQTVTIPSGKTAATLSFYLNESTTETTSTAVHDHLDVQVYDSTNTTLLGTLASYSNLNPTSGYALESMDMSAYIGQSVRLRFTGVNNGTLQTSWLVDDVTLVVQ